MIFILVQIKLNNTKKYNVLEEIPLYMYMLDRLAGQISGMDQLVRPVKQTSWTDQPWPVRIFEDFPFSLYIVAASESDEGLVFSIFGWEDPCVLGS